MILGRRKPFISLFAILISVLIAYGAALILSATGAMAGTVSFQPVLDAPWFRTNVFLPWGMPRFDAGFFLGLNPYPFQTPLPAFRLG